MHEDEDPQAIVRQLLTPSPENVARYLEDMRTWPDGFISATAFGVAAANWPQVRELALQEWLEILDNPDGEMADSLLPVLGFYLAAANNDDAFLPSMLDGWRSEDEVVDVLFGDVLTEDGPALWALMAQNSPEAIRLLEEAALPKPDMDPNLNTLPLEALALLVKAGVHERAAFDALVRRCIDAVQSEEFSDCDMRYQWLASVLSDVGPGPFVEEARGWLRDGSPMQGDGGFRIIDLDWFDKCLAESDTEKEWRSWQSFVEIPEDAWKAMEWMRQAPEDAEPAWDDDFDFEANENLSAFEGLLPDDDLPLQPIMRDEPKIGRNDPCPCGSQKKFKKCCGKPGTAALN